MRHDETVEAENTGIDERADDIYEHKVGVYNAGVDRVVMRDIEGDDDGGKDRASYKGGKDDENTNRFGNDGGPSWINEGLERSNDNEIFKSRIFGPLLKIFTLQPLLKILMR